MCIRDSPSADDNLIYIANGTTNVESLLAGNAIVVNGQLRSGGARDGTNDAEQPRAEGTKYAHRETPSADVLDSSPFTTSQSDEMTMTDETAETAESTTIGVTGSEADRITGPVAGQLKGDGARDCINGRPSFTTSQSTTPTDGIESTQHTPADVPDSTPSTTKSTTSQSSLTNSLGVEALADDIESVQHTPCETSPIDAT